MVPCLEHPGSHVVAFGVRETAAGRSRRYRCTPVVGDRHVFHVPLEAEAAVAALARLSPAPECPTHPGSKVVRNGTYGEKLAKRRQSYLCTPSNGDRPHKFTPPLPRDHVHAGEEHCEHCEELRNVHRGETAAARRHTWPTGVVARGLEQLARGASYAEVGVWARRVTGTARTRRVRNTEGKLVERSELPPPPPPPNKKPARTSRSASAKSARNAWHIAADWVEAFAPVLWEQVEGELRAWALSERARLDEQLSNGEVLERPQVVLVDDLPVYGRDLNQKSRRDAGFFVLAAAETHWTPAGPTARLRLARALAKSNTAAWLLVFDELGYDPDFIVADAGTGIGAAVAARFDPARTKFIPSIWHLTKRIETALGDTKGAHVTTPHGRELLPPVSEHLRQLGRKGKGLASVESWAGWWDELEDLLRAHKLPLDKVRTQRRNNEDRMAAVLDDLARHAQLPISTGGLETLTAKHISPLLSQRRTGFANLERTNLLFDLAVAAHQGAFDDPAKVIELLRTDAAQHDGWTVALRAIADPRPARGAYSSLRDPTLLTSLAEARNLL